MQDPEDAIDEGVMILPGMPLAAVMGRMGQERIDPPPETGIEFIAARMVGLLSETSHLHNTRKTITQTEPRGFF